MAYQRVEILTGTERRRNYTPAEKVRIVEEAFRPGVIGQPTNRRADSYTPQRTQMSA